MKEVFEFFLQALHYFFKKKQFYKIKSLDFGKKNLSTTEHKNKVSSLTILKIIKTKHQNRASLSLIL